MAKRTCKIEGCGRPHKAYGWCRAHYGRWQRNGDVAASVPIYRLDRDAACSVPSCTRTVSHKGLCKAHHNRLTRRGDVLAHIPIQDKWPRNPDGLCAVDDCGKPQRNRAWCTFHYGRWRTTGDVQADTPSRIGKGYINQNGYRLIWHDGQQVPEHRVVMESVLGRPLGPGENVHHKNGERADNRPENLELWITKQPYGQRVGDAIAWAREILARYEGLELPSEFITGTP